MTTKTFDDLLVQADDAARKGDWQSTLALLQEAAALNPEHPGALTGIGSCLIQLGRCEEALTSFEQVVALAPESPQAHNNLGVVHTLLKQWDEAEVAFLQAVSRDADHAPAWKNLALVYFEQGRYLEGVQVLAAVAQSNPEDGEALALLGQCYEEAGDLPSAEKLYNQALKAQPELSAAVQGLERLASSLPPKGPANSPQVVDSARIARPEHAAKLAALKGLKKPAAAAPAATERAKRPALPLDAVGKPKEPAIAFYGPPEAATEVRLSPVIHALVQAGRRVKVSLTFDESDLEKCDFFCFSRPHQSPELLEALERCSQAGKHTLIDLDVDFHSLPAGWPGYDQVGPGCPEALSRLERALSLASLVTVSSHLLAERYRKYARRVEVIPPGWSRTNPLWEKPAPPRETVNIGVMGSHLQPKDALILKGDLVRLMKECQQALTVFSLNLGFLEALSGIPEERMLYLPVGRLDDYPYLLSNYDILLVPLQDNPYNAALHDLPLLEAGVRRIPWVASPIHSFREWGVGGLFAEKSGDWYGDLKRLISEPELRRELGEAGRQKAEAREANYISRSWESFIDQM